MVMDLRYLGRALRFTPSTVDQQHMIQVGKIRRDSFAYGVAALQHRYSLQMLCLLVMCTRGKRPDERLGS